MRRRSIAYILVPGASLGVKCDCIWRCPRRMRCLQVAGRASWSWALPMPGQLHHNHKCCVWRFETGVDLVIDVLSGLWYLGTPSWLFLSSRCFSCLFTITPPFCWPWTTLDVVNSFSCLAMSCTVACLSELQNKRKLWVMESCRPLMRFYFNSYSSYTRLQRSNSTRVKWRTWLEFHSAVE